MAWPHPEHQRLPASWTRLDIPVLEYKMLDTEQLFP
jgi:hypothetical protein